VKDIGFTKFFSYKLALFGQVNFCPDRQTFPAACPVDRHLFGLFRKPASSYMYFFTNMTLIYKQEQTTVSSILTELLPLLYLEYAYY